MKKTPIKLFNPKALIEIEKYLEFSNWDKEPVKQTITYQDFNDIGLDLSAILDAIITIGYNGNEKDISTCASLASIAKKILPINELDFLDSLLIRKNASNELFNEIETLKK